MHPKWEGKSGQRFSFIRGFGGRALILSAIFALVPTAAGCCGPALTPTTGFHFEIGRASVAPSPALVSQLSGGQYISPLGTFAGPGSPGLSSSVVMRPTTAALAQECEPAPAPRRLTAPAPEACTLDAICQRLDALSRQLQALQLRAAQPPAVKVGYVPGQSNP